MRGIPPQEACGYMRPGMAVPERQLSLHEKKHENPNMIRYKDEPAEDAPAKQRLRAEEGNRGDEGNRGNRGKKGGKTHGFEI